MRKRVNNVLGRLTKEELKEVLTRDIRAIDDVLQDKKFLFGGRMTAVRVCARCWDFMSNSSALKRG